MKYKKSLAIEEQYWLERLGIDCLNNNQKEMEIDKAVLEAIRAIYARVYESENGK